MAAGQKLRRCSCSCHVRAKVENVRNAKQAHQGNDQWFWKTFVHGCGEPLAGNSTETSANFLYRAHQWKRKQRRPQQSESKLHAHLRIRRDPARIVVCRASDQPRSKLAHHRFTERRLLTRFARGFCVNGHPREVLQGIEMAKEFASSPQSVQARSAWQ